MNMFKKAAALASVVGALTLASAAHATTTYTFTDDHCTGTCGTGPYGTVSVNGNTVTVNLTGVTFNSNGNGIDTFSFSTTGNQTLTFSSVSPNFTVTSPQTAGSNHEDGFGNWDYILNATTNGMTTLSFTVGGIANLESSLQSNFVDGQNIFFVADVAGTVNGVRNTGAIGATAGGVPEPATWALMIVGLGMAGAMLRRRHGMALTTAA